MWKIYAGPGEVSGITCAHAEGVQGSVMATTKMKHWLMHGLAPGPQPLG